MVVPGEGTWVYNPLTGDLVFTPETITGGFTSNFTDDPTPLEYILIETQTGLTDTASVTIDYAVEAPTAVADEDLANVAGAVTLDPIPGTAGQDSDPDGSIDPMTVSLVAPMGITPTSVVFDANNDVTSFVIPNEGTWSVDEATGAITFTPLSTFTDDPTVISYNVEDNDGNQSTNDATVTIDYVPVAVADVSTGNTVGQDAVINVTGNDTDGDAVVDNTFVFGSTANPLPAGATTSGTAGTSNYELTVPGEGVWTYDGSGGLTFNPDAGFTTDPTVIGYTISDAQGNATSTTVTVDYTELPPVANNDSEDNGGLGFDTGDAVTIAILDNDDLSDGSQATTTNTTVDLDPSSTGTQTTLVVPGEGTWVYNPLTGDLVFTPETITGGFTSNFTDDPTPLEYILIETQTGLTDTASVTIDYAVEAPTAVADEDLANAAGAVTLDPIPGTAGQDSDPDGSIDPMTVSLVAPMGITPTSVVFDANNDVTSFVIPNEGTWSVDEATGAITFTPLSTFTDDPTVISYNVEDNDGNQSTNDATVTIDYVPVAVADVSTGNTVGQDAVINVTGNDTDGDAVVDNTFVFGSTANPLPAGATTSGTPGTSNYELTVPGEGVWTYDGSGGLTFNPDTGFTTDPTVIGYTISDAQGNATSTTVTVDYTELPPVANNDSEDNGGLGFDTGDAVTIAILDNDDLSDGSQATTTNTTVDLDPSSTGTQTTLVVPGEGTWVYNPLTGDLVFTPETITGGFTSNFTDDPTPLEYILIETQTGLTDTASVTIDYAVEAPTAVADEDLANAAGAVTLDPIPGTAGQDSDPDGSIDPMTVSLVAPMGITPTSVVFDANNDVTSFVIPNEGTWSVDEATGAITFTPLSTFTDDPTVISYNVEDNDGNQSTNDATVTIDYVPVAVADVSTGNTVGQDAVINVTGNDTDGDAVVDNTFVFGSTANPIPVGATTSGTAGTSNYELTVPGEGVWTYDGSGGLTFNPDTGFTTDPTVIGYTISDAQGNATSTTVTVDYTELPPVANNDSEDNGGLGFDTGDAVTIAILDNDDLSDGSQATTT